MVYGIDGSVNRWIQSFLSGRKQRVVIEGAASDVYKRQRQCHEQIQPTGFHRNVLNENHAGVSIECCEYWRET